MRVMYINNDGGGFADFVEVAEGTTVQTFFDNRVGGKYRTYVTVHASLQNIQRNFILLR